MKEIMTGRVIRMPFHDVSTDVITPTHFKSNAGEDRELTTLRPHAMGAIRPGLNDIVKPGDIFVCGSNWALGSHRETAVRIFKVWGVQAVVAESAARIWFRNSIAHGFPVFQLKNALELFDEGDQMEIDTRQWRISNLSRKQSHAVNPFPPTVMDILNAGGIMNLLKSQVDSETREGTAI
jgi:3-isopropylmalate/(R)-2-methylmalate dehydratase small subunit